MYTKLLRVRIRIRIVYFGIMRYAVYMYMQKKIHLL